MGSLAPYGQGLLSVPIKLLLMLNREQKDKLKLIVEAIDDKLTKEGYIFTARHFDAVMDGMQQVLQQTPCTTPSELLLQMYNEGRELAKDGFETWQDRDIHSANENALLRVMRLIKKRQQMA